jgi:hypothetical protein
MRDAVSAAILDRFVTSAGPARLSLMTAIRPQLDREAVPPRLDNKALDPFRYLLDQAAAGAAPLDEEWGLTHEYAMAVNEQLGFDSPGWLDGSRTHLEIDMLLSLTRAMGATLAGDGHEVITPIGMSLLHDPGALWRTAAWFVPALAYKNKQIADMWELTLAWLLAEGEDWAAHSAAMEEAAGDSEGADLENRLCVAIYSLYTLARALHMFVPRRRDVGGKPRLTDFGRATAREALRSAALLRWNEFGSRWTPITSN